MTAQILPKVTPITLVPLPQKDLAPPPFKVADSLDILGPETDVIISELIAPDEWQPSPPPTDLIFEDGEPLETYRHQMGTILLLDCLHHAWRDRRDFYAGGDHFIYFSQKKVFNKDFRGPDFFVVLNVELSSPPPGWVVWENDGRYPDVIIEFMSDSTAKVDVTTKKKLYERTFKTSDYFVYHPYQPDSLKGWHLGPKGRYRQLKPDRRGWLWCETFGYWLGLWEGVYNQDRGLWLRFFDRDGNPIPLPREEAQREAQRAQQEAQRAEREAQRAQQEAQRAQQEAQRADQEAQRSQRLADRLRELGIDPETI